MLKLLFLTIKDYYYCVYKCKTDNITEKTVIRVGDIYCKLFRSWGSIVSCSSVLFLRC